MTTEATPPDGPEPEGTGTWSLEEAAAHLAQADANGIGPSQDDELEDEFDDLEDNFDLDEAEAEVHALPNGTPQTPHSNELTEHQTVKIDGQDHPVSLDELKAGYQRQADYTRKTQSLADERRQLQSERSQYQQLLTSLSNTVAHGPADPPDQALLENDPAEYVRQSQQWQARQQIAGAAAREQARLHAMVAQEEAEETAAFRAREDSRLAAAVPGWSDPSVRQAGKAEIGAYLTQGYGATPDELEAFHDHRLAVLAHKALQYDKLLSNRDLAQKKVRSVPQVQAPGAARSKQDVDEATVKALRDKFHKSGSIDDAAKLMRYLGG